MLSGLAALDFSAALSGLGAVLSPDETAAILWSKTPFGSSAIMKGLEAAGKIDMHGMSAEDYFKSQARILLPQSGYGLSRDPAGAISTQELMSRLPQDAQKYQGMISSALNDLLADGYYIVRTGGQKAAAPAFNYSPSPLPLPSPQQPAPGGSPLTDAWSSVKNFVSGATPAANAVIATGQAFQFQLTPGPLPNAAAQRMARQVQQNQAQWSARLPWIVGIGGALVIGIILLVAMSGSRSGESVVKTA